MLNPLIQLGRSQSLVLSMQLSLVRLTTKPSTKAGQLQFHTRRYQDAIAPLEKALELEPDAPFAGELSLYAGRAEREVDRLDSASAHFRRAAALTPDPVDALVELSNVMFLRDRDDEAEEYLRRARELRPSDPTMLLGVGEALRKAERHEEAIVFYRESLRIDPHFVGSRVGLGAAFFNLKRYEEAFDSLTRATMAETDPETAATAHYLAGRTLLELDRPAEAAVHFESALERDPNHTKALAHLAHLRFGQKKYEDALDLYRTHATLKPDSVTVHANIGVTLYFLGRHAEALESMERVLRLDPDHQMARKMVAQLRKVNQ